MSSPARVAKALQLLFRPKPARSRKPRSARTPKQSDPFLHSVWVFLRQEFFPERVDLDDYNIQWSSRPQKRVLASCNIRRRRVVVAQELLEPAACRWIAPVVYHEMCHAVLGDSITTTSGKRMWHGPAFRELEARHPDSAALDLWMKSGGWAMAVRMHRSRTAWRKRALRLKQAISTISSSS